MGNSAECIGGGAYEGTLNNCIVYYNTADAHGANYDNSTFANSCTTPLPSYPGNIARAPLFVNANGWSNLRLRSNSPCINAGDNSCAVGATDLDGLPRISGDTVDMGACEFQSLDPFHAWLEQYGLPTDGSADFTDSDGDGHNNQQEWVAGSAPTEAGSVLRMVSVSAGISGVAVSWSSVTNRTYALEMAPDLGAARAFSVLQSNITGLPGTTTWTDTNAVGAAPRFYRVRLG